MSICAIISIIRIILFSFLDKSNRSKEAEVNQSPHTNSLKNTFTENGFNNCHKIINNSKQFGCDQYNDTNISFELKTNLKMNDLSRNVGFNDNIKTFSQKAKHIPERVLFNIAKLFEVYNLGVNIENFKVIYKVS